MGGRQSLMDTSFNLRLQAREAQKLHEKCLREEEQEKIKIKSALEKSNVEAARVHAGNSIRKHNEALRYLQFHAKLETIRSQVDTAARSERVTTELKKALPSINRLVTHKAYDSVDLFQQFEKVFEDLEVREAYADQSVQDQTAHLAPNDEIDDLITKVAEEHALDVGDLLSTTGAIITPISQAKKQTKFEQN
ncbi:Snf7 family [Babesia duncani]|uniref:Snf7 family n=1 Tax=Babesia duncani TaxID=323732 RepID=A0AAD9PN34_9APIC|nr:Snf7 family [Babesia duncani]